MQPTTPASEQGRSLDNLFEPFIKIDSVAINALIGPQNVNYMYEHPFEGPMTALYFASSVINYGVVKILLQIDGVDVSKVDRDGKTPLLAAACFGYGKHKEAISIIDLLMQKGADPNAVDNEGNNALHLTVAKEHSERIKGLIDLGIDVNATNNEGKTPLHFAISKVMSKSVKALLDGNADPLFVDKDGKTYLHSLASCRRDSPDYVSIAKSLIEKGVDINAVDIENKTVIQIAKDNGNTLVIDIIEAELSKNPLDHSIIKVLSWLNKNTNEEQANQKRKTMLEGVSFGSVSIMLNLEALGNLTMNPKPSEVPPAKFSPRAGAEEKSSSAEPVAGVSSSSKNER